MKGRERGEAEEITNIGREEGGILNEGQLPLWNKSACIRTHLPTSKVLSGR